MPTTTLRQEAVLLLGQRHQIAVGRRDVAKTVFAQHFLDPLVRRIGVEHQIDLGLRLHVVAERIVQQVVENLAVQLRLVAILLLESHQGRPLDRVSVTHAQCELAHFLSTLGQHVGLQVEHDLQAVLDLAQELVVLQQQRAFEVAQAADLFELNDGFHGVAAARVGQVGPVEQLEELDHEFDIADPAMARLDVPLVGARGVGLLLDAAFQGLDAADVGPAQVATIDPWGQPFEEVATQGKVSGHRPSLQVGLPFPGPPAKVVVAHRVFDAHHHGPASALGSQPQIDPVDRSEFCHFGQEVEHFATHLSEEFLVGHRAASVGFPFSVVEEDQVDVARVVQLHAAEFPHPDHNESGRLSVGSDRRAALAFDLSPRGPQGSLDQGVGQMGNLGRDRRQRMLADDIAQRDPQRFTPLRAP